jgi:CsoR family transcriptional regulator, copper-sensing transcriptional repressor
MTEQQVGQAHGYIKEGDYIRASEKVATLVLRDHMDHCVREALADGENADEKVRELQEAVERFLKLD